jgi:hypothetical protein
MTANERLVANGLNPKLALFSLQKVSQLGRRLTEPDFYFLREWTNTESPVALLQGMANPLLIVLANAAVTIKNQ